MLFFSECVLENLDFPCFWFFFFKLAKSKSAKVVTIIQLKPDQDHLSLAWNKDWSTGSFRGPGHLTTCSLGLDQI